MTFPKKQLSVHFHSVDLYIKYFIFLGKKRVCVDKKPICYEQYVLLAIQICRGINFFFSSLQPVQLLYAIEKS